jgi:hypothetical protein
MSARQTRRESRGPKFARSSAPLTDEREHEWLVLLTTALDGEED